MIFGYTYAEARKTAAQIISAVLLLVGFFVVFDPNLEASLIAVSTAVVGIVAVFGTKNATADDWSKAVNSLEVSVVAVIGTFTTVSPDTTEKWGSIIALLVPPIWVYFSRNDQPEVAVDPTLTARRVK